MAGAAVKKATETLVKAAQQASVQVEEEGGGAFGPAVSTLHVPSTHLVWIKILNQYGISIIFV
jgi:hypothetical protein